MSKLGKRSLLDNDQLLEGGAGGGGAGYASARGQGLSGQAAKNSAKSKSDMADELIRLDKMMAAKRDTEKAKARPERQEAERKAVVREEGGVKKTEYPYAGPNEFKKGGTVSASKRADGCAVKGKTKGRMV
jgi:hypothetical protein